MLEWKLLYELGVAQALGLQLGVGKHHGEECKNWRDQSSVVYNQRQVERQWSVSCDASNMNGELCMERKSHPRHGGDWADAGSYARQRHNCAGTGQRLGGKAISCTSRT